jgi:protein-S-isoprenylcysteine O-methyltransferase Ste14
MADVQPEPVELPAWRAYVFKHRGTLLALPALALTTFGRPSAASAAAGLPVALLGEALRCWAVGYSGVTTRGDTVTAPALVTAGPYAYVRNPLYVGNFLTALGFSVAFTGGLDARSRAALIAVGLGTMAAVYATIVPLEEAYLRRTFGAAFDEYVARVPRTVPRLSPAEPQQGNYDASVIARAETRTFATFGAMLAALVMKAARG